LTISHNPITLTIANSLVACKSWRNRMFSLQLETYVKFRFDTEGNNSYEEKKEI